MRRFCFFLCSVSKIDKIDFGCVPKAVGKNFKMLKENKKNDDEEKCRHEFKKKDNIDVF